MSPAGPPHCGQRPGARPGPELLLLLLALSGAAGGSREAPSAGTDLPLSSPRGLRGAGRPPRGLRAGRRRWWSWAGGGVSFSPARVVTGRRGVSSRPASLRTGSVGTRYPPPGFPRSPSPPMQRDLLPPASAQNGAALRKGRGRRPPACLRPCPLRLRAKVVSGARRVPVALCWFLLLVPSQFSFHRNILRGTLWDRQTQALGTGLGDLP